MAKKKTTTKTAAAPVASPRFDTPAFPRAVTSRDPVGQTGMNLRDYFAAQAGAAMYGNADLVKKAVEEWSLNGGPRPTCVAQWFAGMAYEFADAMLAARKGGAK